jgi:hypothetical protein
MADLEVYLWALALTGLIPGSLGILWERSSRTKGLASWGRRVFVATLLLIGAAALLAAFHRADGLIPLGLVAGLLVAGMLWENPHPAWREE